MPGATTPEKILFEFRIASIRGVTPQWSPPTAGLPRIDNRLLLVPSARVVEDAEGRLLLKPRSKFGKWGLPGGVPDEREDFVTCAVCEPLQETRLETRLQVRDLVPFGFGLDLTPK
ncbi:NUDIX domain-containing protein [Methylobacterium sp. ARG-1]|uniref:NUDIX hydrolase n=1 Tax=Methylobacterium sp. ARG-1 TaxID=1692501 RepID=UPI0006837C2E|nr:NUDIX domain-containing protein [Methylobacterium sp. ARG-1]KNY24357.1 hypothetical protein AKJ13_03730 [Methylobacterium sp. ARG-1]